jgi:hypothetical protein
MLPKPDTPESLEDKIHLYNAMLHLGIIKFFTNPLVEQLCADIYSARLADCELETLEHTVARFHSRGVSILDPVLSCFAGAYGLRSGNDRNGERLPPGFSVLPEREGKKESPGYLEYDEYDMDRVETTYKNGETPPYDTVIIPPELPILGHCVRHWSGVRESGDARAAHVGYPLHIGKMVYYIRELKRKASGEQPLAKKKMRGDPDWPENEERGELLVDSTSDLLRRTIHLDNLPGKPRVDCTDPTCSNCR